MKAAIQQGGFVAGGGAALLHSIPRLSELLEQEGSTKSESWRFGVQTAQKACEAPFRQLVKNATGEDGAAVLSRIIESKNVQMGVDLRLDEERKVGQVENLIEKGVIDPVQVVKNSILYGSSIASILLTSDCAVLATEGKRVHEEFVI